MEHVVVVLWDCRVKATKPLDTWRLILETAGQAKPTTLLVLQPPDTTIPSPIQTAMRMTNSKMLVGADSVDFAFLELCIAVATSPSAQVIVVSDDVDTFGRTFRACQVRQVVFITNQKLSWPLSEAKWIKPVQFVQVARRGKS
jgi:hypothetical protein